MTAEGILIQPLVLQTDFVVITLLSV